MEFREIQEKGLERASVAVRCCYIKPSGERCGSPAMRGLDLCYYHDRYQPKPGYRNLPCLEDPHSVQCAIQEIIEDMLNGLLDYKKAALALYGLQTAASNLKQMRIAEEKKLSVQRSARSEEAADTAHRAPCTEEEEARSVQRAARTEESRAATIGSSPARSAGYQAQTDGQSRRDDWLLCGGDEVEEFELIAGDEPGLKPASDDDAFTGLKAGAPTDSSASACAHLSLPTTNDERPTTFIESPRQPQHVKFGLTSGERERMKEMFPDMKKIRAEFLASLTPEELAIVGAAETHDMG